MSGLKLYIPFLITFGATLPLLVKTLINGVNIGQLKQNKYIQPTYDSGGKKTEQKYPKSKTMLFLQPCPFPWMVSGLMCTIWIRTRALPISTTLTGPPWTPVSPPPTLSWIQAAGSTVLSQNLSLACFNHLRRLSTEPWTVPSSKRSSVRSTVPILVTSCFRIAAFKTGLL